MASLRLSVALLSAAALTFVAVITLSSNGLEDIVQHSHRYSYKAQGNGGPARLSRPSETSEMAHNATSLTPELLLSAPRRSHAEPNDAGTLALYAISTYSFEEHERTKQIWMLDLSSGQSTLVTSNPHAIEPHWIEDQILYLQVARSGELDVIIVDPEHLEASYVAATLPARIWDLKLQVVEPGKVAILCAGKADPMGNLYNESCPPKRHHSGRLYDTLMVRHWDSYRTENTNALFYGLFQLSRPHRAQRKARYGLPALRNALRGTKLESPIAPFPSGWHYDLSKTGIMFVAKDPELNAATNTRCNVYHFQIPDFAAEPSHMDRIEVEGLEGAAAGPALSPDGRSAAFLKMKTNGYEADKFRVILVPDLQNSSSAVEILQSDDGQGRWDRSPSAVVWSNDGKTLYLAAEDEGRGLLFRLPVPSAEAAASHHGSLPTKITNAGTVSAVYNLGTTSPALFLSSTSFVDSSIYSIYNPNDASPEPKVLSSFSHDGAAFGISASQFSAIRFPGSRPDTSIHAWVVKPADFDPSKTYPLAYMVHGGPQGVWLDDWSTRWNPAVFAAQGYVVVLPNPTGSTSFGQAFTDAVQSQWGGAPYDDLVNGLAYIDAHLPFVDTTRAVALGASFGGYMMNWINGHPLGRRFRALVVHDGVFSLAGQLASDEQYFPTHDLGGHLWDSTTKANKANDDAKVSADADADADASAWTRWDPARWTNAWNTPALIVHNARDYRLPISEGLAAFNVLQMRGVESRFLSFPDENHWVLGEENSRVWHRVVLGWINRFVDLPAPEGEDVLPVR